MAAAARRPPPSRSAQGAAATLPALFCSLPFPPHCSVCVTGDRGNNPNLEAERMPGFFQLSGPALWVPCSSCLLSAQAPPLCRCRHHHVPLWTMPFLRGISGSNFALCCMIFGGHRPCRHGSPCKWAPAHRCRAPRHLWVFQILY